MIAILGYGRFGAALGGLFSQAGMAVRALDPAPGQTQDGIIRVNTLAELVDGARFVILAVPVDQIPAALGEVAPRLQPDQVVLDVGSVKSAPCAALEDALGDRVAWAGTHPLFGPLSLARGERPLNVVICPSPHHPQVAAQVADLFVRGGCQVIWQSAADHDHLMAWTHALAFFVAKGMLDAGVPLDQPHVPPSFQAIARTIEAVRADAGHLFSALHRQNPFAREARQRLIQSLHEIDRTLDLPPPQEGGRLDIPDLGAQSPALREARDLIDEVDRELLALLSRRAQIARRAGQAKAEIGRGVHDPEREAQLLRERGAWAVDAGLAEDSVQEIFQAILRFSRRVQGA